MYGNVKPDHNHMSMGIRRRFSERLTLEAINGNCLYCKNLGFCLSGFQLEFRGVYNFFFALYLFLLVNIMLKEILVTWTHLLKNTSSGGTLPEQQYQHLLTFISGNAPCKTRTRCKQIAPGPLGPLAVGHFLKAPLGVSRSGSASPSASRLLGRW